MKIPDLPLLFILALAIPACEQKECACPIDPAIAHENDSNLHAYMNSEWAKTKWVQMSEPVLFLQNKEAYRFSYTILVGGSAKSYRVEQDGGNYMLFTKEHTVQGMTDSLISSYSRRITKKEWREIRNAFRDNCFWTMPITLKRDMEILDGVSCLLEGFNPEKNNCTNATYHAVSRLSPDDTTKFAMISEKFMALERKNETE